MRKKLTPELLEQMLTEYGIRQRIAKIDPGAYYPMRTADGANPFALAKADPELAVPFVIDAPQPLHGTVIWKPTQPASSQRVRLQVTDFWLEPEWSVTTLSGQSAPENEDLLDSDNEYETTPDTDLLGIGGAFQVNLDNQENEILNFKISPRDTNPTAFAASLPNGSVDSYDLPTHEKLVDAKSSIDSKVRRRPSAKTGRTNQKTTQKNAGTEEEANSDIIESRRGKDPNENRKSDSAMIEDFVFRNWDELLRLTGSCNPYHSHEAREDAIQDVLLEVLIRISAIPSFQMAIDDYRNGHSRWLFNLILQKINWRLKTEWRKKCNQPLLSIDALMDDSGDGSSLVDTLVANEQNAIQILLDREDQIILNAAIAQLSDLNREAIVLHHFEDMLQKECAELLGIAANTYKTRLKRARGALFEILTKGFPEG